MTTPGRQQTKPTSAMCVSALVLGVVSIALVFMVAKIFVPFVFAAALAAVIFGSIGEVNARRNHLAGGWYGRVGVLLGALAVILILVTSAIR